MGLENLKSVFNDIRVNANSPIKGRHGDLTHPNVHSELDDIENNLISDPNSRVGMMRGILTYEEGNMDGVTKFDLPNPPDERPLTGRDTSDYNDILKHSTIDPEKGVYSPTSDLSEDSSNFGQHAPFTEIDSIFANKSIRLITGESLIKGIEHTFGTEGRNKDLIEIGFLEKRQYPSPLSQGGDEPLPNIEFPIHYSKEPPYGGQNLPPQLGYSQNERAYPNNPVAVTISKKQKRSGVLFQNLGKNNQLGEGEFILETLYNVNHTAVTDRKNIEIRPPSTSWWDNGPNGVTGTVYTNRTGMGTLAELNIKSHGNELRKRQRAPQSPEPYIVNNIGSVEKGVIQPGNNMDWLPFNKSLEDLSRLTSFYTSYAGLGFIFKENVNGLININSFPSRFTVLKKDLNKAEYSTHMTSFVEEMALKGVGEVHGLRTRASQIMIPAYPTPGVGNTGLLNFLNMTFQGKAGKGSIRKPFAVQYSDLVHTRNKDGELLSQVKSAGDAKRLFQRTRNPLLFLDFSTKSKLPLGTFVDPVTGIDNIAPITRDPSLPITDLVKPFKSNPFLGLGPQKQEDKIAKSKPAGAEIIDTNLDQTDFYVRFKDMRNKKFIYFRGFVTGITENVTPSYTTTNYIGRSEPVHRYLRAERDLAFNMRLYPSNKDEQDAMYEKIEYLTGLCYPKYTGFPMLRMQGPFTELYMAHIGSKAQGQFGYIKSLTYTVDDSGDWDADKKLPKLIDVAISYQILHKKSPNLGVSINAGDTDFQNPTEFYQLTK